MITFEQIIIGVAMAPVILILWGLVGLFFYIVYKAWKP